MASSTLPSRLCLALAAGILLVAAGPALALPKCAPASPEFISEPTYAVDQLWQRYRTKLTPEHRCCAIMCEPIIKLSADVEKNAYVLRNLAVDTRLPKAQRDKAHDDSNLMFSRRQVLNTQYIQCLNETRPTGTGSAAKCGTTSIDKLAIAWYAWCDDYLAKMQKLRDLLLTKVRGKTGAWQITTNYFHVKKSGNKSAVDTGSVVIRGSPETKLPSGTATAPFVDLIMAQSFTKMPGVTVDDMYMRFQASAYRPAGGAPIDTSALLADRCPGYATRPQG